MRKEESAVAKHDYRYSDNANKIHTYIVVAKFSTHALESNQQIESTIKQLATVAKRTPLACQVRIIIRTVQYLSVSCA